jgi:hypothetical protein
MPDVGWRVDWVTVMADRLLALPVRNCPCDLHPTQPCSCIVPGPDTNPPSRPTIAALSHHYYVGGPPSSPEMTIPFILRNDPRVAQDADISRAAAAKLNVPFRMTEGNTCYRGGKPGLSDTFASALWSADYLLRLASLGYAGVNLHGGDGKMVASSLGGTLPGDALVLAAHGDPAAHPHPYYTPIAHIGDNYLLEPVAYGMKFANHFAGSTMIPLDFNPGPVNATAYAANSDTGVLWAIINKDANKDINIEIDVDANQLMQVSWVYLGQVGHLRADSLTSRTAHENGALVASGTKVPKIDRFQVESDQRLKTFVVPRSSAILIRGNRVL